MIIGKKTKKKNTSDRLGFFNLDQFGLIFILYIYYVFIFNSLLVKYYFYFI
jgi:hypothetical protein